MIWELSWSKAIAEKCLNHLHLFADNELSGFVETNSRIERMKKSQQIFAWARLTQCRDIERIMTETHLDWNIIFSQSLSLLTQPTFVGLLDCDFWSRRDKIVVKLIESTFIAAHVIFSLSLSLTLKWLFKLIQLQNRHLRNCLCRRTL